MSTRLDVVLQKYPEHEEGLRLLAARDPSPNLKYLDWGAKMLASKQALAPEVADVVELFHQFAGQRLRDKSGNTIHRVRSDLYSYQAHELADLRDLLLTHKRARDRKRRERERLYRIEGRVEADTLYDSTDLIVRHIKNKEASAHYGRSTKWCIPMLREDYFNDYTTHNATFFFFERKAPLGDEFDKVAMMVPRNRGALTPDNVEVDAFTSLDRRCDMFTLVKAYGPRVFDIFRAIYDCSEQYPDSCMFSVFNGTATEEQLRAAFADIATGGTMLFEIATGLEAICCNVAAPFALLQDVASRATALVEVACKRARVRRGRRRHRDLNVKRVTVSVTVAMAMHPNVPESERVRLLKALRRRHIDTDTLRIANVRGGPAHVDYEIRGKPRYGTRVTRLNRRGHTVKHLEARAKMLDRMAARARRRAAKLKREQEAKKQKKKRQAQARICKTATRKRRAR